MQRPRPLNPQLLRALRTRSAARGARGLRDGRQLGKSAWGMEVADPNEKGRSKDGGTEPKELSILSSAAGHSAPSATQRKPARVPEDWERSKTTSEGRGGGGVVLGSGRHSRLQDPVPSLPFCPPQSPPHSAPHSNVGPRALIGAGTGPVPP